MTLSSLPLMILPKSSPIDFQNALLSVKIFHSILLLPWKLFNIKFISIVIVLIILKQFIWEVLLRLSCGSKCVALFWKVSVKFFRMNICSEWVTHRNGSSLLPLVIHWQKLSLQFSAVMISPFHFILLGLQTSNIILTLGFVFFYEVGT